MKIYLDINDWTNFWDTGIPEDAYRAEYQDPTTLTTEITITDAYWQQLLQSWLTIKEEMERADNE